MNPVFDMGAVNTAIIDAFGASAEKRLELAKKNEAKAAAELKAAEAKLREEQAALAKAEKEVTSCTVNDGELESIKNLLAATDEEFAAIQAQRERLVKAAEKLEKAKASEPTTTVIRDLPEAGEMDTSEAGTTQSDEPATEPDQSSDPDTVVNIEVDAEELNISSAPVTKEKEAENDTKGTEEVPEALMESADVSDLEPESSSSGKAPSQRQSKKKR